MTIHNSPLRNGRFTSSKIAALTKKGKGPLGFGAPAITYIEEVNMERRLGRSISTESNAKPLAWGKLLETMVFNQLGTEYSLTSQETDQHPTIEYWVGSKDAIKYDTDRTVVDYKCPITLKSFCQLVQPIYDGLTGMDAMNRIREDHPDGDKYFYQLVSNAIINDCKYAELIVYMPYESSLPEVKEMADGNPSLYWLNFANDDELPFLNEGGYYKDLNVIRFEVPKKEKEFLTECVERAGTLLLNGPKATPPALDKDALKI